MAPSLNIGLVGLGIHGSRYAQHLLQDVPDAHLVAVCRSDAVSGLRWAASHQVRFHAHWQDLIADPLVHAVAVVTPPSVTADIARAAVEASKAVVVEKPLAAALDEGRALVEAVKRSGIPLMVAQTLRWNSVVCALRRELRELGDLRVLSLSQRLESVGRPWLDRPGSGGALLNTGVHAFDLLRYLSGREVEQVWCRTERTATRHAHDTFVAGLSLGGGVLATVENCRSTASRSGRIELVGSEGQLVGDHVHGELRKIRGRHVSEVPVDPPVPTVREALREFVQVAAGTRNVPVTADDGLRALEIALACQLASREERRVLLADLTSGR